MHEVVNRRITLGEPDVNQNMPKIGVALVFCEEPLDFIEQVTFRALGGDAGSSIRRPCIAFAWQHLHSCGSFVLHAQKPVCRLPSRHPETTRLASEALGLASARRTSAFVPQVSASAGRSVLLCALQVGCKDVQYHLYSKCGTTRKQAEEMAPTASHCFASFKEVPITLETELAWPKHHAQYLEHIISRCLDS